VTGEFPAASTVPSRRVGNLIVTVSKTTVTVAVVESRIMGKGTVSVTASVLSEQAPYPTPFLGHIL